MNTRLLDLKQLVSGELGLDCILPNGTNVIFKKLRSKKEK